MVEYCMYWFLLFTKVDFLNSPQEVSVIEITVDCFECGPSIFFIIILFGPSKKIIHAQHVCVFKDCGRALQQRTISYLVFR